MKLYVLTALAALSFAFPARAGDANMIAVVNIQQVLKDATVAKQVRDELEKKQKSFQGELTKKDESLQKEDQELAKQRGVLSKEAFEEKTRAFRKKVTDVQKEVQSKKALLDNAYGRALGDIKKTVTAIIAEMAKEKGFILAIPMEAPPTWQVLYADPKLDITAEVLERLNKKLPKLDVKFDAPEKK